MRYFLSQIILSIFMIMASFQAVSQFELKTGISGSQLQKQVGGHIEAAYLSNDIFSIGLFGSYGKLFSYLDRHHVFATGLVMEVKGRFNENMKIFPLLNLHLGRSWEYRNTYYTYGDENQYSNSIDKHITGFSIAARLGMISNFTKTNRIQFQFDFGLLLQSVLSELNIFSTIEPIGFVEARLMLVYSF